MVSRLLAQVHWAPSKSKCGEQVKKGVRASALLWTRGAPWRQDPRLTQDERAEATEDLVLAGVCVYWFPGLHAP